MGRTAQDCTINARQWLMNGNSLTRDEAIKKWGCKQESFSSLVIGYLENHGYTIKREKLDGAPGFRYSATPLDDTSPNGDVAENEAAIRERLRGEHKARAQKARLPELGEQLLVRTHHLADDEGTIHIAAEGSTGTWLLEIVAFTGGKR